MKYKKDVIAFDMTVPEADDWLAIGRRKKQKKERQENMRSEYKITRDKFFDAKERQKLLKVCKEMAELDLIKGRKTWPVRCAIIYLALNAGLRVSEIAELKIKDLNLTANDPYLLVRKGKRRKSKSGKFTKLNPRDVYIDKELTGYIKKFLSWKKKSWKESVDSEAPLFAGRGGKHFTPTALEISFKKAIEKAGLPSHYSIHSCRHTYATHELHATGNMKFVQKQLGHSNMAMTGLYADILPSEKGKLANMKLKELNDS